jgi:hypothetical protein
MTPPIPSEKLTARPLFFRQSFRIVRNDIFQDAVRYLDEKMTFEIRYHRLLPLARGAYLQNRAITGRLAQY